MVGSISWYDPVAIQLADVPTKESARTCPTKVQSNGSPVNILEYLSKLRYANEHNTLIIPAQNMRRQLLTSFKALIDTLIKAPVHAAAKARPIPTQYKWLLFCPASETYQKLQF